MSRTRSMVAGSAWDLSGRIWMKARVPSWLGVARATAETPSRPAMSWESSETVPTGSVVLAMSAMMIMGEL